MMKNHIKEYRESQGQTYGESHWASWDDNWILEAHLKELGHSFQSEDFSSIYYLGSRFLRKLITDSAAYPGLANPINKLFFEIEKQFSGGGMGAQQAVVISKSSSV